MLLLAGAIASSSGGQNALAPTSERQKLMSAMGAGFDNLFKASIFIRKNATRDERLRVAELTTGLIQCMSTIGIPY